MNKEKKRKNSEEKRLADLDDGVWSFSTHVMNGILITQPIRTLNGVVPVQTIPSVHRQHRVLLVFTTHNTKTKPPEAEPIGRRKVG
jgi:hypothetical protein